MKLHPLDVLIILAYVLGTLWIGFWLAQRATRGIQSYFLGGNDIPWYFLGLSNASGMFDVSGTMIAVAWLFVYGLKSTWIPWLWPVWNQIFMMVFLSTWLRRSNCLTGAEWIRFRFGDQTQARLCHLIVVLFAIAIVIAFMAYFVEGMGKFAAQFLPWDLSVEQIHLSSEDSYALLIIGVTTIYTMKGGFYSVVGTEVMQFVIMTIACFVIGTIGMMATERTQIQAAVPANWDTLWCGWQLDLDWSNTRFPLANDRIQQDGYSAFGFIFTLMLFKGVWASLAGPVPSYDMQRVLSTRTPREAAKMFGLTPVVLCLPRYFMIAGITVLALVYMDAEKLTEVKLVEGTEVRALDFEKVLPFAVSQYVPVGFKGLLLAGLLAAFMSTFAAFINAGSAYVVNDIYLRYVNPQAAPKLAGATRLPCHGESRGGRCGLRPGRWEHPGPHGLDCGLAVRQLRGRQCAEVDLVAIQCAGVLRRHAERHCGGRHLAPHPERCGPAPAGHRAIPDTSADLVAGLPAGLRACRPRRRIRAKEFLQTDPALGFLATHSRKGPGGGSHVSCKSKFRPRFRQCTGWHPLANDLGGAAGLSCSPRLEGVHDQRNRAADLYPVSEA